MNGHKQPTFNQVSNIAKAINIPTGLLLLPKPMELIPHESKFRTANSEPIIDMSSELRDTLLEMGTKQDFLRSEIEEELSFIGKYSLDSNKNDLISVARSFLGLTETNSETRKSISENSIKYFRTRINQMGVFVFFNGKVGDNTHRPLDTNEFRGFVFSDKKAPIIFVNQTDSKNGQVFTLIHEFVHLFLNKDEIFNVIENKNYHFSPLEAFVNSITAELLVPGQQLRQYGTTNIDDLTKHFPVSKYTIARRLLDLGLINRDVYLKETRELDVAFQRSSNQADKFNRKGNYNTNLAFRMDGVFTKYVNNAVQENRITSTDAMNILGVGYKGYKKLQESAAK